jgi:hypothetical protein
VRWRLRSTSSLSSASISIIIDSVYCVLCRLCTVYCEGWCPFLERAPGPALQLDRAWAVLFSGFGVCAGAAFPGFGMGSCGVCVCHTIPSLALEFYRAAENFSLCDPNKRSKRCACCFEVRVNECVCVCHLSITQIIILFALLLHTLVFFSVSFCPTFQRREWHCFAVQVTRLDACTLATNTPV